jgi:hypothetical protein
METKRQIGDSKQEYSLDYTTLFLHIPFIINIHMYTKDMSIF